SPREPAASNPANDRKPNVEASASVERSTPDGSANTWKSTRWPPGALPSMRAITISAMRTRISSMETASIARSERAAVRICREAIHQIAAQATSASGSHGALSAIPAVSRSARPNTAAAEIDTAGNTRYVPSSAQPAKNPAPGPSAAPTKPYTDPACAKTEDRRTKPYATSPTPSAATTYASG